MTTGIPSLFYWWDKLCWQYLFAFHEYLKKINSNYPNKLFKLSVGYGDIAATNDIEALFITLNMIVFSCVFAYSINNIGFILQEIEKSSKQLNDNITTIQR